MYTLNEFLRELRQRGVEPVKIESGYHVGITRSDLLCKCDGDGEMAEIKCPSCGAQAFVCGMCLDEGLITRCRQCTGAYMKKVRELAKLIDIPWEEVKDRIPEWQRLRAKPVDIDQLIAEGKLERVTHVPDWLPWRRWLPPLFPSMTIARFKLLVDESELPEHVQHRIVRRYTNSVNDVVVETIIELDL